MLGDTLRKEREKQRLTIQDVELGTSIRASYIEAIEKGDYSKMPGRVYTKGFIKNYANFLNLNGDEFVKQFLSEVSPTPIAAEKIEEISSNENKKTTFSVSGKRLEIENKFSTNHLVAAIVAIAVLVGGVFYSMQDSESEVAKVEVQKTQEVKNTPPPDQVASVTPAPPPPAPVAPTVDGVNLKASFSDDCWMLVTIDGAVAYEGVINAGQVMDWKGNSNVNVRVGNAGAVEFIMNGQSFGKLGEEGDVVDRDFTR